MVNGRYESTNNIDYTEDIMNGCLPCNMGNLHAFDAFEMYINHICKTVFSDCYRN